MLTNEDERDYYEDEQLFTVNFNETLMKRRFVGTFPVVVDRR